MSDTNQNDTHADQTVLALSRQDGEFVVIGEGPSAVFVKVVESTRGKTRLAFYAPRTVKINRLEVAFRRGFVTPEQVPSH